MAPPVRQPHRAWLALASCVLLVALSILFVDRPASTWSHEHLGRPELVNRITHLADPLPIGATLGLAGVAIAVAFCGKQPGRHSQTLIAASLAIIVAAGIKEQLKFLFGRPWPETWTSSNPSWISDHAFGFHFAHGGTGWESFPSGHMAEVAALAAVVWLRMPRIRWLSIAMAALVAAALWCTDYHFVGDIVAGAFLGVACGIGMVAVACRS